jgi:hypothetical protein
MVSYRDVPGVGFDTTLRVFRRPGDQLGAVRRWLLIGAIVNFVAVVPVLVLSIRYHLFSASDWPLERVGGAPPTHPDLS